MMTVTRVPKGQTGTSRLGKTGRQQYTPTSLGGAARRGDQTTGGKTGQRNPRPAPPAPSPHRPTKHQGRPKTPEKFDEDWPVEDRRPPQPSKPAKGKARGGQRASLQSSRRPAGGTPKARHRAVKEKANQTNRHRSREPSRTRLPHRETHTNTTHRTHTRDTPHRAIAGAN